MVSLTGMYPAQQHTVVVQDEDRIGPPAKATQFIVENIVLINAVREWRASAVTVVLFGGTPGSFDMSVPHTRVQVQVLAASGEQPGT